MPHLATTSYSALFPNKSNDKAWNNRGIALGSLRRYEDAIASYDQAVAIKPDKHAAWYNRGIALKNLGREEEATESFDKAIALNPAYGNQNG